MKRILAALMAGAVVACGSAALAEMVGAQKIFQPQDIKWGPGPAALPAGAESAVLYGDPAKEGMFAMRIKAPKGYRIPPHSHHQPELVTVISGKFTLGLGKTPDRATVQTLPAGALAVTPPGVAHYVFVDEDTVVQINAMGPWGLDYVEPKDDPRKQKAKD